MASIIAYRVFDSSAAAMCAWRNKNPAKYCQFLACVMQKQANDASRGFNPQAAAERSLWGNSGGCFTN